jgi:hypothetical protein
MNHLQQNPRGQSPSNIPDCSRAYPSKLCCSEQGTCPLDLFIRTIGIARATVKIGLANLVYNIQRLLFLRRIAVA